MNLNWFRRKKEIATSPGVNLESFINQTLRQIIGGVKEAQSDAHLSGAVVNPGVYSNAEHLGKMGFIGTGDSGVVAQVVHFDVALTATAGTDTKGGVGVVAGVVTLGSTGASRNENTSVSRVQFSVPVTLPPPKRGATVTGR